MPEENEGIEQILQSYTPAIFIGVGGAGTSIAASVRKKIITKFRNERLRDWRGIVNSVYQFIVIDTTGQGPEAWDIPASNYFNLGDFDGQAAVETLEQRDSYFKKWWYPEYRSQFLHMGAAIRINGRLSLFHNLVGTPSIAEAINDACSAVGDIFSDWIKEGKAGIPINIYIFNSISGGTGSGMCIDLAFHIRHTLGKNFQPNIYGYFLTPEVVRLVAPASNETKLKANAYAFLRELDFWQSNNRGIRYEWKAGDRQITSKEAVRPFDLVHFIHRHNDTGRVINDFSTILRLTADIIYYDAVLPQTESAQGGARFEVLARYRETPLWEDHPISYGSAAVATLRCPLEKITKYIAMDLLSEVSKKYIMKEPEGPAEIELEDFLEHKAGISVGRLQSDILNDPNYPGMPAGYIAGIRQSGKKNMSEAYEKSRGALESFKEGIDTFFRGSRGREGKRGTLVGAFKKSFDSELSYLLNLPAKNGLGLTAQFLKKLLDYIAGQLEKRKDQAGSTLVDETDRLKIRLRDLQENLENTYAGRLRLARKKEELIKDFKELFEVTRDYIMVNEIRSIYQTILNDVTKAKDVLKFIREELVDDYLHSLEGAKETVWKDQVYDDERGGVVVEVLDEKWAKQELQKIKADKDSYEALIDDIFAKIITTLIEEFRKTWEELKEEKKSLDSIRVERKISLQREFYTQFLESASSFLIKKRYERLNVWEALVEGIKTYKTSEESILREIKRKLTNFASKISPWWPVMDPDLRFRGLDAGIVFKMGVILCNIEEYEKFKKKYSVDLAQIIGTRQELLATVPSDDKHCIQVIFFKYGTPMYLFGPIADYKEKYNSFKKQFPNVPLYADQRYERDKRYKLPDLVEETIVEAEKYGKKLVFVLSENIVLPGESESRVRLSGRKNVYTFFLPAKYGIPNVSSRGRRNAQDDLFESKFKDGKNRYKVIHKDLRKYWNDELLAKERRERLEEYRNCVGERIKEVGTPDEAGRRERELIDILREDLAAIQAKIDSGEYEI